MRRDMSKPGPLVVEPDASSPNASLGERAPVGRRGQRDDRVGMRVVDVRRRDERVQERLDRRPRLVGRARRSAGGSRPSSASSISVALAQRQQLVEPEPGEAGGGDRREVGARALDPEHAHLAAGVVGGRLLGGRVAAADVRERAVGAEQVRAVDEPVEDRETCRRRRRPSGSPGRGCRAERRSSRSRRHLRRLRRRRARRSARAPRASRRRRAARRPSARTSARTTVARLVERPDLAERHRLHEQVAEQRRLLRAREHGQAGGARRPAAEQRVARAAADDVQLARVDAGDRAEAGRPSRACFSARLSRMQRTTVSPTSAGLGLAGLRAERRGSAAACRRARGRASAFGSTNGPNGGADRASATSSSNEYVWPCVAHARRHSCSSHRPVTLRSSRNVPATPPSFVRFAAKRLVVDHRLVDLDADERPGADAEEDRAGPCERHGGDGRAGVVGRDRDDAARWPRPVCVGGLGAERRRAACPARRPPGRPSVGMSSRSSRSAAQRPAHRVEALGRRRVRAARSSCCRRARSGTGRGSAGAGRRPSSAGSCSAAIARELEDRVDRQQLDAGALVELARRDALERRRERPRRGARRGSARGSHEQASSASSSPKSTPQESTATESTAASRAAARSPSSTSRRRALDVPVQRARAARRARSGSGAPRDTRAARRRSGRARRGRSGRRGRRRPSSPSARVSRRVGPRGGGRAAGPASGSPRPRIDGDHVDAGGAPRLDLFRGRARVGDDPGELARSGRTTSSALRCHLRAVDRCRRPARRRRPSPA